MEELKDLLEPIAAPAAVYIVERELDSHKVEYRVNEHEGTIEAVMQFSYSEAIISSWSKLMQMFGESNDVYEMLEVPHDVHATVHCSPEMFSLEEGIRQANYKLQSNFSHMRETVLLGCYNKLATQLLLVERWLDKYQAYRYNPETKQSVPNTQRADRARADFRARLSVFEK